MADDVTIFSLELVPSGWFAAETDPSGWFNPDLLDEPAAGVTISANQTLASVSQSASLSAIASISANQTLAPVSQSAALSAIAGISASQTLQPVSQSANIDAIQSATITASQTLAGVIQSASIIVTPSEQVAQDTHDGASPYYYEWWRQRQQQVNRKARKKLRKAKEPVEFLPEESAEPVAVSEPILVPPRPVDWSFIGKVARDAAIEAATEAIASNAEREATIALAKRRAQDEEAAILLMMM